MRELREFAMLEANAVEPRESTVNDAEKRARERRLLAYLKHL
jgi:hypothetical protein